MSDFQHHDLIIVGGGMVGATLACELAQQDFDVALIETRAPDCSWPQAEFDIRTSAITRASQHMFEHIGAWDGMAARRICPYREMRVWDATGSGAIHFDSAEIGEPDLGHIIENAVIQAALWERTAAIPGITRYCPALPQTLLLAQEGATLALQDGTRLAARLIVGADGGQSWTREQAGLPTYGWSYQQHAVVAVVRTQFDHQETAWQRFNAEGPLAFLPLAEKTFGIVWSTAPEHAEQLVAMDKAAFLKELHLSFGDALGRMLEVGARAAYPLRLSHTLRYTATRLALVGDAAHSIHPLAGQGVNLGLSDARALIQTLRDARAKQQDLGHALVLRRYERARKADNLLMLTVMDGFKRLFSNDQPILKSARNLGLNLTDRLTPVKNTVMRQALGL
ncbi:MAG: UbiH/UbiF/VisC/COQ6 family ubiquinone biosynthesis hydroxylase [Pseudomonadota bacterium]